MCRLFIGQKIRKKFTPPPALYPSSKNTDSDQPYCLDTQAPQIKREKPDSAESSVDDIPTPKSLGTTYM